MISLSESEAASPDFLGSIARAGDIFQILRDGRARTRSELSASTGLARSTVASRVDALISLGLVGPAGEAISSGGRPPSRFAFKPASRVVLAVDVGATHVVVALTDLQGAIIAKVRAIQDVSDGPENVLRIVVDLCHNVLLEGGRTAGELAGIGVGLPGPVEHSTGRPIKPPIMPGWDGFDVVSFLQRSFHTTVLVDNDVNIMALGEQSTFWPNDVNLLFVKVATGIGAGIISNGELQRGANGTAGDLGHVAVARSADVLCCCGNLGCLEALASGPAMARTLREAGIEALTGGDVLELAGKGDATAIQVLRQAGRDLGTVLASCVNLLNPSVIVIGGSLAVAGEHFLAGVRENVYRRSLPLATSSLRISTSQGGDGVAIIGASKMVSAYALSPLGVESSILAASELL